MAIIKFGAIRFAIVPYWLNTATMLFKNITWRGFGIDAWLNQLASEKLAEIEKQL